MAAAPIKRNEKAKITAIYKPSDELQEARRQVYQRKTDMAMARSKHEPVWEKALKQYNAWRPPKDVDDWQSNIVPPFTTAVVEAELSEMIDQTLQPKVSGRGVEDKQKAMVLDYTKDYTWEVGQGDVELYKAIKEALILGTSVVQEYYWRDARQVRVLVEFDPEKGIEKYEEKEVTDFDDVYMEHLSLWDFYIDENARSINSGPYRANDCIRRYVMHIDRFKATYKGPIWDPLDAAKYVKAGGDTEYYEYYQPPKGIGQEEVEVLWYWSRVPDKLIVVANDVVIRNSPNPYNHKQLPFAQGIDVMKLHQFYHKGEPELLESIQEELNTIRRQRIDRAHLDIDKTFLISNRESLTDQDLITRPHKGIFLDDPKSVVPLEYGQVPQSAYLEEDRLKEDGERVTGMDVRSQSVRASGSATEAAILKEATLRRLRMKIWLLSRTLLVEVARLRVANIIQFYNQPRLKSIIGAKESELKQAMDEGRITTLGGAKYMQEARTIRTQDIKLVRTPTGIKQEDSRGENYFDVRPEDLTPSKGGFDIRLSAEPTFPVSKTLQQQKVNELFQHPVFMAALNAGLVDLKKSFDKLVGTNDFDPEDFEKKEEQQSILDPEMVANLALTENELMLQGNEVPGTPYAPREHTEIHLNAMGSQDFKDAIGKKPEILQYFIAHILFEEEAQKNRPQVGATVPVPGQAGAASQAQAVMGSEAQAASGARSVGETGMTEGIAG